MARLENWINQGYVPTPELVLNLLTAGAVPPLQARCHQCTYNQESLCKDQGHRELRFLDPCCGDGAALKTIADNMMQQRGKGWEKQHGIYTVGIEVNDERAEDAKQNLNRVIHSDMASVEIKQEVFDFAWVNPPYDYKGDGTGDRVETDFLIAATMALHAHGTLAYVVPMSVAIHDLDSVSYTHLTLPTICSV